jgi:ribosomal protein S18 acetylase RimI-like enzyme
MITLSTAQFDRRDEVVKLFAKSKHTSAFSNIIYSNEKVFEQGCVVVAEVDGKLAGAYCVRHCVKKPQTTLYYLFVAEEHRGEGVSHALMHHMKDNTPHSCIVLGVANHNEIAIRFYTRHGFTAIGECYKGTGTTMQWTLL